jgi:hypothetical protein
MENLRLVSDYYFLASALPSIRLGEPLELSYKDFIVLLHANLSPADREKTRVLRRFYDIQNLRLLWMGQEIEPYGNFSSIELNDVLITGIGIPGYMYDYAVRFEEKEDRIKNFPLLISQYFSYEIDRADRFVKDYLSFERELRLVFAALRAKRLNRDIMKEFQFEDPADDLVSQIIAQKDAKTYEPPARYEQFRWLYESNADDPVQLYRALAELRFQKVDEMLGVDMLSIDRINGYLVQLIIADKLQALDKQKGLKILDSIIREAS